MYPLNEGVASAIGGCRARVEAAESSRPLPCWSWDNLGVAEDSEQLKSLRDELLAAQAQRLDLAKYKLVAIAVLGSVALGANGVSNGEGARYVIALIPFAALYIDSLGDSKKIQFYAIGSFLRQRLEGSLLGEYERFCNERRDVFFQNYSYKYSTALVSGAIAVMGIVHLIAGADTTVLGIVEILSGLLGVVGAATLAKSTAHKVSQLS